MVSFWSAWQGHKQTGWGVDNELTQAGHLVELCELVNRLVANERLADKEDEVGCVDGDELGERLHQARIVLHAAGGVDKHNVSVLLTSVFDSGLGNLTSEDELKMKLE